MLIDDPKIVSISDLNTSEKALMEAFSCGKKHTDNYLTQDAQDDSFHGITRTFCFFDEANKIMFGYFSLTVDRVHITNKSLLTPKFKKQKNYVNKKLVPGIQLHHFAISESIQKQGYGRHLMDYVFALIEQQVLPFVGACLITVQSETDVVKFYKKIGFESTGQDRDRNTGMAIIIKELFD